MYYYLYVFLSPKETATLHDVNAYQRALQSTDRIHFTSWIPLLILVLCTVFKLSAFVSLAISSLIATMLARITNGLSFSEIWSVWFDGYEASTTFEPVNELLTKGGMSSMFFTISLVILALGFGGLLLDRKSVV